jgi:hypothetical protein
MLTLFVVILYNTIRHMQLEHIQRIGLMEPFRIIPNRYELVLPRGRRFSSYWINSAFLKFAGAEGQEVVSRVGVSAFYDTVGSAIRRGRSYLEFVEKGGVYDLQVVGLERDSVGKTQQYNQADWRMVLDSVSLRNYEGEIAGEVAKRLRLAVFLDCDQSAQAVFAFESQGTERSKLIIPETVTARVGDQPLNLLKRARNGLMFPPENLGLINDFWGVFYLEPRVLMANEHADETGLPPRTRAMFRVYPSDRLRAFSGEGPFGTAF